MRKLLRDILISFCLGMVVPAICVSIAGKEPEAAIAEAPVELPKSGHYIHLREAGSMDLEQYLVGVLLAEMPAEFEQEALKAQAVAARTFTWKAHETGGKHGDGSVCRDYTCCQAYCPEEDYLLGGGTAEDVEKMKTAIVSTSGQVLTYDGELIEAVYFSCSGGRTEDALAVWGVEYPYLRSIHSSGEDSAPYYSEELYFSKAELESLLEMQLGEDTQQWITDVIYTHGGGIAELWIGGRRWTGTELRASLGLRSTDLEFYPNSAGLKIVTHGYGHRVGMSQYGAEAMAVSGKDYREILAHYYQGTVLEDIPG